MLKKILKLDGAQKLTKNEQKSINGGLYNLCKDLCFDPNDGKKCIKCSDI
jgi:hypothetical protein